MQKERKKITRTFNKLNAAPLERKTLVERILETLTDYILTQKQPGDELPSMEFLANHFNVSVIAVREAIRMLEAHGIIQVSSGKKAVVMPVNGDMLKIYFQRLFSADRQNELDLMEFRSAIETHCVTLACRRRTSKEFALIQSTCEKMAAAIPDPVRYTELDLEFHYQVALASHNSVYAHLVSSMREVIGASIRSSLAQRADVPSMQTSLQFHQRIVQAFQVHDIKAAEMAITAHFEDALYFLKKRLDALPAARSLRL